MTAGSATARLHTPPWTTTAAGAPRRVGVELEMSGLTLDGLAGLVATAQGLATEIAGRYERRLTGDAAGDWVVELDFSLLKKMGREQRDPGSISGGLGRSAEDALALLAEVWVPLEVVTPPLPLDRLPEVEALVPRLRAAGARGTSDSLLSAFGLQLNPEVPSREAALIAAVLKAFLCLYDWLFRRASINLSRRVTRFIDPFPKAYVRRVVDPTYAPGCDRLIDDYLAWNATRNRALDMLPLFLELDEERVRRAVPDPRVKPRPAFHYRLPDCEVHLPHWGLHVAWNDWIEVERLAADPDRLVGCTAAYHAFLADPIDRWLGDWASEIERSWLGR